jgi:hypothetical protein
MGGRKLKGRTSLELKFSAQHIHEQLDDGIHGGKGIREEDEANDDREFLVEAEGLEERAIVDEDGEEGEDVEHVELPYSVSTASHRPGTQPVHTYLGNAEELGRVAQTPVT